LWEWEHGSVSDALPIRIAQSQLSRRLCQDFVIVKSCLNLLADEIVVKVSTAAMKGSYGALAHAVTIDDKKVGHLK
jgi:hypothetical protein